MQLKLNIAIVLLALCCVGLLYAQGRRAMRDRKRLAHVIHVNGTRGKSTVCRLIEAGLRAGSVRVFCKTTGTDPMTIGVDGQERLLRRRGRANIREQLSLLHLAADQGAETAVLECMAVRPELQSVSQRMLQADIGVITNVRRDHTDVMGDSPEEIADSLSCMIPPNGVLFTAETALAPRLAQNAEKAGCQMIAVTPDGTEPAFEFAENIALALAVCRHLGVDRETALSGMRRFKPDPYSLASYRVGPALLINGLSANDAESTLSALEREKKRLGLAPERLILLINNRTDRGARTEDMLRVCLELKPDAVWLLGSAQGYVRRRLHRHGLSAPVLPFRRAGDIPLASLAPGDVVFAVGNIAMEGRRLIQRVREEGSAIV